VNRHKSLLNYFVESSGRRFLGQLVTVTRINYLITVDIDYRR